MDDLVSIIIVNYNTEVFLTNCILSIKEKTKGVNYEIIVVDNDSEQNSLNLLMQMFPEVTFHFIGENLGFGSANNIGAEIAKGKYLLFLNPDTVLQNNAIRILLTHMQNNEGTGGCGGDLLNEDLSPGLSYFEGNRMWQEFLILFGLSQNKEYRSGTMNKKVSGIMGADLFVPKKIFIELNGFDPIFFMYFEESELCYRIRKKGYKIMYIPDASIVHIQGVSSERKSDNLKKWSYQEHWFSKWVFFYKTEGLLRTKLVYLIHLLRSNIAINVYLAKKNNDKLNYWKLKKDIIKQTFNKYQSKLDINLNKK